MKAPLIHVVGVGLAGAQSLLPGVLEIVQSADLIVGARRHLSAMAGLVPDDKEIETWALGDLAQVFDNLKIHCREHPDSRVVVLATGDPLFFGLGRLLLSAFPADQLAFHPQLSAVQLAFSRLKIPWQDATLISVHGRGEDLLCKALKRGDSKIAVLTDNVLTPQAIAQLISALDLPIHYRQWVCENLGGDHEQVSVYDPQVSASRDFAALNVVVLVRCSKRNMLVGCSKHTAADDSSTALALPLIGLPDSAFKGYSDRPMLMTKREIRLLILGAIAPLNRQVIWDVGAGTGSVSIELSRLCPQAQIYAIEKSAMGAALIAENAERLAIAPIKVIRGKAPVAFSNIAKPNRVFIGGSNGQLINILNYLHRLCSVSESSAVVESGAQFVNPSVNQSGDSSVRVVLSLATLEHLAEVTAWLGQSHIAKAWQYSCIQANIARSLPVGTLTRLSPLNPVSILTLVRRDSA